MMFPFPNSKERMTDCPKVMLIQSHLRNPKHQRKRSAAGRRTPPLALRLEFRFLAVRPWPRPFTLQLNIALALTENARQRAFIQKRIFTTLKRAERQLSDRDPLQLLHIEADFLK